MSRTLPDLPVHKCENPPRVVAWGFDTVQEAWNWTPQIDLATRLDRLQQQARNLSADLTGIVEIEINDTVWLLHATGAKGGIKYRLENDGVIVMIRNCSAEWGLMIRYKAAGLWSYGWDHLHAETYKAFRDDCQGPDDFRVTRVDYCWDFLSPEFTDYFTPGIADHVVAHSSCKNRKTDRLDDGKAHTVSRGGAHGETLDIGSKKSVQVSVYDKAREINQHSGKTWMIDLWVQNLDGEWPWQGDKAADVWRLEVRMGKEFLKPRGANVSREIFKDKLAALLCEALYNRRLCLPVAGDTNVRRWPLHPIWQTAVDKVTGGAEIEMEPLGRQVTGYRDELAERQTKIIAGSLRALTVLREGEYNPDTAREIAEDLPNLIEQDEGHKDKTSGLKSRYSLVDDAI